MQMVSIENQTSNEDTQKGMVYNANNHILRDSLPHFESGISFQGYMLKHTGGQSKLLGSQTTVKKAG
jgi:hypothetical protein